MNKTRNFVMRFLLVFIFVAIILIVLVKFDVISFKNKNLPEAITLNQVELGIKKNDYYQLRASVYPENSYNGKITWHSSDSTIVDVNEITGYVYAKNIGDAIVTAKIAYNNLSIDCVVHVSAEDIPVSNISFATHDIYMNPNSSYEVRYQLYPVNANYRSLRFVSTDNSVVEVDNKGVITAKNGGEAYVKAIIGDKEDTLRVNVTSNVSLTNRVEAKDLLLSNYNVSLALNGKIRINSEVLPEGANDNVTYESLNNNIVTVDNGLITAIGYGKTQVLVKTINGITKVVNVNVKEEVINIEKLSVNNKIVNLSIGDTYYIPVKVTPSNATDQTLEYLVFNKDVIKIENGIIYALKGGSSKVIIKSKNNITCELMVNVNSSNNIAVSGISVYNDNLEIVRGNTKKIEYEIEPVNADTSNLKWSSSDNSIVTVSDKGLINATGVGDAIIYITSDDVIKKINVKVIDEPLVSFTTSSSYLHLQKGETTGLVIGYVPNNASNIDLKWSSSDNSVATVNDGIIKAIGNGKAIVTISSNDVTLDIIVEVGE